MPKICSRLVNLKLLKSVSFNRPIKICISLSIKTKSPWIRWVYSNAELIHLFWAYRKFKLESWLMETSLYIFNFCDLMQNSNELSIIAFIDMLHFHEQALSNFLPLQAVQNYFIILFQCFMYIFLITWYFVPCHNLSLLF